MLYICSDRLSRFERYSTLLEHKSYDETRKNHDTYSVQIATRMSQRPDLNLHVCISELSLSFLSVWYDMYRLSDLLIHQSTNLYAMSVSFYLSVYLSKSSKPEVARLRQHYNGTPAANWGTPTLRRGPQGEAKFPNDTVLRQYLKLCILGRNCL